MKAKTTKVTIMLCDDEQEDVTLGKGYYYSHKQIVDWLDGAKQLHINPGDNEIVINRVEDGWYIGGYVYGNDDVANIVRYHLGLPVLHFHHSKRKRTTTYTLQVERKLYDGTTILSSSKVVVSNKLHISVNAYTEAETDMHYLAIKYLIDTSVEWEERVNKVRTMVDALETYRGYSNGQRMGNW
jgi:hypothetical protein